MREGVSTEQLQEDARRRFNIELARPIKVSKGAAHRGREEEGVNLC